jgi:hypothetical protein
MSLRKNEVAIENVMFLMFSVVIRRLQTIQQYPERRLGISVIAHSNGRRPNPFINFFESFWSSQEWVFLLQTRKDAQNLWHKLDWIVEFFKLKCFHACFALLSFYFVCLLEILQDLDVASALPLWLSCMLRRKSSDCQIEMSRPMKNSEVDGYSSQSGKFAILWRKSCVRCVLTCRNVDQWCVECLIRWVWCWIECWPVAVLVGLSWRGCRIIVWSLIEQFWLNNSVINDRFESKPDFQLRGLLIR